MDNINSRIKKFLSYYKPYPKLLCADIVCALVVAGITLVIPLCVRYITKNVLEGDLDEALSQIYRIGAAMVGLIAVHTACNLFVSYKGHVMGAKMERDMRSELFEHYQKLSFGFYDEQKTGQLMTRLTNDVLSLAELYHHVPEDIIIALIKFVGAFVILINIDIKLTLLVFIFFPIMIAYSLLFYKRMNAALRQNSDKIGDINAHVEDNLSGIRAVKSFTNEEAEIKKFNNENNLFLKSRSNVYLGEALFYEGLFGITLLITVAVAVFGGAGIVNSTIDLSDLITFLLYIGNLIEPIYKFININRLVQEGFTGFNRFMEILEVKPDIRDSPCAADIKDIKGNVEFVNVGFRYKETNDNVLKDISLNVSAGEYVALVGASGVGKTTLCSLIPRFYQVTAGEILLDGININSIKLSSLRQNIGIVQQEVYLFAGTVIDNIRYGKLNATREEIIEAAKKANAHDFIMELPNGYDTDIGQRGIKLSGGQKQRLSIARVFLKNPPILIFDEATSALDNESEKVVKDSLENLAKNRTAFVIAHRLSTIRNAKRIIVLTDQGINEQGTHDELINKNGVYAGLYNMQFELY